MRKIYSAYMGERGRKKTVSDEEILRRFAYSPDPAFFTSEFTDVFDMSRQGILSRLDDLEDQGYLRSKKAAGRRVFWITTEGLEKVSQYELDSEESESNQ